MLRLSHISDSHGYLVPASPLASLIVHSGDFLPNLAKGPSEVVFDREVEYQDFWVRQNIEAISEWLGGRPLLLCRGNHDFIDLTKLLRELGLDAINIEGQVVEHSDKRFYGFPYVPWIQGRWNFELNNEEMSKAVEVMRKHIEDANFGSDDILVAHCPPAGCLDDMQGFYSGLKNGNRSLANLLTYSFMPAYLLCGHFHDATGIRVLRDEIGDGVLSCLVSNAARTVHTFEI